MITPTDIKASFTMAVKSGSEKPGTQTIHVRPIRRGTQDLAKDYWAYDDQLDVEMEVDTVAVPDDGEHRQIPTWKEIAIDYTQNCTLHGLRFVGETGSFISRRALWFVIFSCSLGFFMYYGIDRINFFFQFQKNVNVEINYLDRLTFPAITFCNQNKYKITELDANGWYGIVYQMMTQEVDEQANTGGCVETQWECADKTCIDAYRVCDLFPDCSDQSDELQSTCQKPYSCPLVVIRATDTTSETAKLALIDVLDYPFHLQPYTYSFGVTQGRDRPFYAREDSSMELYLYYKPDKNRWEIGVIFGNQEIQAYSVDPAHNPQLITELWQVIITSTAIPREEELIIQCQERNSQVLDPPVVPSAEGITLYELENRTAHRREDFLVQCLWKRSECKPSSIKMKRTDMGLCFTFDDGDDMFIEQSGPGNGLSLMLNVEYFEYSFSSGGIGIKLLVHNPDDEPLVSERGVAVSPGLYSFMSVETTEVANLPHPYGDCDEQELRYFDKYTKPRCLMECETEFVAEQCDCYLSYQPPVTRAHECEINEYLNCSSPTLVSVRGLGNCSSCPNPCSEATYVATTSFATVFGNPVQDATERYQQTLQGRLASASEVSQRVVPVKIAETYRVFHDVTEALAMMQRFTKASISNMQDEMKDLEDVAARITTDCTLFRDTLTRAREIVHDSMLLPMKRYIDEFDITLKTQLDLLVLEVETEIEAYRNAIGSDNQQAVILEADAVIGRWWVDLKANLELLQFKRRQEILQSIDDISHDGTLQIYKNYFDPLRTYITLICDRCMTANNDPLIDIHKEALKTALMDLLADFNELTADLDLIYENYLKEFNLVINAADSNEVLTQMQAVQDKMTLMRDKLLEERNATDAGIEFIDACLEFVWRQQCQLGITNVFADYLGDHNEVDVLYVDTHTYIVDKNNIWQSYYANYFEGKNMTLQTVGILYEFDNIQSFISRKETRLETSLYRRKMSVENVRAQVGNINYLLLAMLKREWISSQSAYIWDLFQAGSPSLTSPSDIDTTTATGHLIPTPNYTVLVNAEEKLFWDTIQTNLDQLITNLAMQMLNFTTFMARSKFYLDTYVANNKLTDTFYEQNFIQVELFYKELTERKVTQMEAYTYQNLLSELGGFMGLLLGASVLSLAELFDAIIFNGILKATAKIGKKVTSKVTPTPPPDLPVITNGESRWAKEVTKSC